MPRKCEDHTLEDQRREFDEIEEISLEQILEHLACTRAMGGRNSKQGSNARAWSGAGGATRARSKRTHRRQWRQAAVQACGRHRGLAAAAVRSGEHWRGGGVRVVERETERGGSRGEEEEKRLIRGARGRDKRNRSRGPANPKAPEGPMVQRHEHRCIHRNNFDRI